jgi:hypothetical protein
MEKAIGLSRKAAGLRPWLLTFRGNPKKYLPDVQERYFPGIEIVRVVDNGQHHTMEDSEGCNHCFEMMCEEGLSSEIIEHYCSAFFTSSEYISRYATTFRYYASEHLPPVKPPKDRIRYELDMKSLSGKTWQYRREVDVQEATINSLVHHAFRYHSWASYSVRVLRRRNVGPHNADKVPCFFITQPKFGNLQLEHVTAAIRQIHIKTYFYIRSGTSIHRSFSSRGLLEFESTLRNMAEDCLDKEGKGAELIFQLFTHHGTYDGTSRQNMIPVIEMSFSCDEAGQVVMVNKHLSEEFLACSLNTGCGLCRGMMNN